MDIHTDLALIARQEAVLCFPKFTETEAWELGNALQLLASRKQLPIVIDITRLDRQLFFAAMPGSSYDNQDWCRKKRNVVVHFGRSSYFIEKEMRIANTTLAERYGLPSDEYAAGGGSFPINVQGSGMLASVTVSGLVSRADHNLIVNVLCKMLGVDDPSLHLED